MRRRRRLALLGMTCLLTAFAACTRANLDVITHIPTVDGGGGSDGGGGIDTTPSVTCPTPAQPAGDTTVTVQVNGASRSFVLHVPQAYDGSQPVPLILDFHAINGSGSTERTGSPYPDVTDPEGVVMAFPNGLRGPSGTAWNVGPCCVDSSVDDVAFSKAVVNQVSAVACIDSKRVYAVGPIMGAGMAYYLACRAADVFASVAGSGWDLLEENVADCQPTRPITVVSFRNPADTLVPYDGGYSSVVQGMPVTFLGAQATFQKWAAIDGCTGSPSAPDSNGCSTYSSCQGGVEVELCTRQGSSSDVSNASIAWPVLKRHPMP
jgi:polyhydroxybutyrate depolymerase